MPVEFEPGKTVMVIYSPIVDPISGTLIKCFATDKEAVDWAATHKEEHFTCFIKSIEAFQSFEHAIMFASNVPYHVCFWIRRAMKHYRFSVDGQRVGV